MKLEDIRVESHRNTIHSVSDFTVSEPGSEENNVKSAGMAVKIGLCFAAVLVAVAVREAAREPEKLAEVSAMIMIENIPQETDAIGTLRYVEAKETKWAAPVVTSDVELLREVQMVRFTAAEEEVCACISGKVKSVASDDRYGRFVRIVSEDGNEIVLYGFDSIHVTEGDTSEAEDVIGTAPIGRSVFLKVAHNGSVVDPSDYVDLSIRGQNAAV